MKLNKIPGGEVVVIDTNIFLYAINDSSIQCKGLLKRCAEGDVLGVVCSHILAEIMHRLMMAEARDNGWITKSNPAKQLSEKPERVKLLHRYERSILSIFAMGVHIEAVRKEDFVSAIKIQREAGLLTNDALTVAIAERLSVQSIASADKKLNVSQRLTVYVPSDLKT